MNTFAGFLRRCYDQIYAAVQDRLPVIFVGHYSGLDYFTDGKSHQSLHDIGFMRMFADIDLYEPANAQEVEAILKHLVERMNKEVQAGKPSRPAYVRLHRQAPIRSIRLPDHLAADVPYLFPGLAGKGARRLRMFVAGPHFLEAALTLRERLLEENISLDVVKVSAYQDPTDSLKKLLSENIPMFVLESHLPTGGLADFLRQITARDFTWFGPNQLSPCTRTLSGQLKFHRLDVESLYLRIKEWVIMQKGTNSSGVGHHETVREASRGI